MDDAEYRSLRKLPGNGECVDCGAPNPDWGSPPLGVFFCLDCAGYHRGLGTHLSFVRSATMDRWTEEQLRRMRSNSTPAGGGGNDALNRFLIEQRKLRQQRRPAGTDGDGALDDMTVRVSPGARNREFYEAKYDCPEAELYRRLVKWRTRNNNNAAVVDGCGGSTTTQQQQPTMEQVLADTKENAKKKKAKTTMQGFGSSPSRPGGARKENEKKMAMAAAAAAAAAAVVVVWFILR